MSRPELASRTIAGKFLVLVFFCLGASGLASAIDSEGPLEDPALQSRFEKLTWQLRCLVCQNQNIADSNADLAKDLRRQTRTMLLDGKTDAEILEYMTDRYGDFVLYQPRFTPKNWLLWGAPLLFLGGGGWFLFGIIRRQSARAKAEGDDAPEGPSA